MGSAIPVYFYCYIFDQKEGRGQKFLKMYLRNIFMAPIRHFKNRYPYAPEVDRHHQSFDHQRLFRVNARKLRSGTDTWHEYLTGKEVQFHHYPGKFDFHNSYFISISYLLKYL